MTEPSLNYVLCPDASGGHRMAYWQWGNPAAGHVLLCVHGLTRQGRDFDVLALPFRELTPESGAQGEALLWQFYDQITARTLLVRGLESDLLSVQTALVMTQRGPKARLLEFVGVGHAPTFMADDQVQAVVSFLLDE